MPFEVDVEHRESMGHVAAIRDGDDQVSIRDIERKTSFTRPSPETRMTRGYGYT